MCMLCACLSHPWWWFGVGLTNGLLLIVSITLTTHHRTEVASAMEKDMRNAIVLNPVVLNLKVKSDSATASATPPAQWRWLRAVKKVIAMRMVESTRVLLAERCVLYICLCYMSVLYVYIYGSHNSIRVYVYVCMYHGGTIPVDIKSTQGGQERTRV